MTNEVVRVLRGKDKSETNFEHEVNSGPDMVDETKAARATQ
jgi:hypothetical protein